MSELLIALAILGVIATFAIPKVLQSQQNSKKEALLRETISAISEVTYAGVVTGQLNDMNVVSYLGQKLNAVKICSNALTQGCWPGASDWSGATDTAGGMLLHNGVMIFDFENDVSLLDAENVAIDYNGTEGPNMLGEDQVAVNMALGPNNALGIQPGRVAATVAGVNVAFYNDIFSN